MDLHPLKTAVPYSIRQQLSDGMVADFYEKLQKAVRSEIEITIETPLGPMPIQVFDTWGYVDYPGQTVKYEPVLMNELANQLDEESIYYDIGSRWGIFTKLALKMGVKPQKIHGFESDQDNFNLLKKNHIDDEIHLTKDFVGEDTLRLDEYVNNYAKPTTMKIDIEGAEARALRGANELLNSENLMLFIEIHPVYIKEFGDHQGDICSLLNNKGFNIDICTDNRMDEYTWRSIEDVDLPETGDYLIKAH